MKKKLIIFSGIALVLVVIASVIGRRLPIITGFAAKDICSNVFVSGRNADSVIANDINFMPVSLAKSEVDYENKTVTSKVFGLSKEVAVYREGCGCTLLADGSFEELMSNPYHSLSVLPENSDTVMWPTGNLLIDTTFADVDYEMLQVAIDSAFDEPYNLKFRKTLAVVILYKGQIIGEKYAPGIDKQTPLLGWSMNKSITNALVGILVKQGKLDVQQTMGIPEWQNDERKEITLHHLLQMESGLKWRENYSDRSTATIMLYMRKNVYDYAISCKQQYEPGTFWEYSTGTTNIIAGKIRKVIGDDSLYHIFPRKELFNKIGMTSAVLETDVEGNFISSSYGFATTRDWAKLGLLYLNDGVWEEVRILPEGWVQYSVTPSPNSDGVYGAQIWLNASQRFPDVPKDMYGFHGYQGQRVIVIPSKDLVIVRMGLSSKNFDDNRFLSEVVKAVQ